MPYLTAIGKSPSVTGRGPAPRSIRSEAATEGTRTKEKIFSSFFSIREKLFLCLGQADGVEVEIFWIFQSSEFPSSWTAYCKQYRKRFERTEMPGTWWRFLRLAVWTSVLVGVPGLATAGYGPRLYVDIHPPGWVSSKAVCVNGRGQAVGNGMTAQGERGFLWSGGRHTVLLPPGAHASRVWWVNDRGDVAGTGFDGDGTPHAFLFRNGEYFDPTPGWRYSEALFVGSEGMVTGGGERGGFVADGGNLSLPPSFSAIVGRTPDGVLFGDGDNVARMFIPGKGTLSLLPPGGESASSGRINESGLATFSAPQGGVERGYVFSGGFMIFMTPPGWTSSVAESINNADEVVGWGDGPQGRQGFLRSGFEYEVISCPGCVATEARSVNDFGEVAGSGESAAGETHAFVSYPASAAVQTQEPSVGGQASAGGGCSAVPPGVGASAAMGAGDLFPFLCAAAFVLVRRTARRMLTSR